ncbi:Rieske 2Fe-2S domain-containing protein [Leisingera sp. NJS201]|uniref:Rieske 2Fe-2S domain-containing protein n=1 Tax=Leisingera sp. NJS201 TaxID=2508306 RepID=UPI0034A0CD1F
MRPDLIGGEGYLRNCWYVAGRSEDFGRELTALTMLEEQIVIYRDTQGKAIALEDACPHRKLPLSRGTIEGDHVVCGYHGLTFDCRGECVIAPTQLDNPPRRAAVQSYPAEDRWGFLWLWMGDPEQADRARSSTSRTSTIRRGARRKRARWRWPVITSTSPTTCWTPAMWPGCI